MKTVLLFLLGASVVGCGSSTDAPAAAGSRDAVVGQRQSTTLPSSGKPTNGKPILDVPERNVETSYK